MDTSKKSQKHGSVAEEFASGADHLDQPAAKAGGDTAEVRLGEDDYWIKMHKSRVPGLKGFAAQLGGTDREF